MSNTNLIDINYLPLNTQKIFEVISKSKFSDDFTLVGGTALSLQIKHRLSEDLDFIYDGETLNLRKIKRNIAKLFPNYRIIKQDESYQIDFLIEGVKVTFFSTGAIQIPFNVNQYSFKYYNLNIATKSLISILKLSAIADRNTLRDYYDLYFIAKYHIELLDIINLAKKYLPNISPITYTETIIYTNDLEEFDMAEHLQPKELINKIQISDYFVDELKKIKHLL